MVRLYKCCFLISYYRYNANFYETKVLNNDRIMAQKLQTKVISQTATIPNFQNSTETNFPKCLKLMLATIECLTSTFSFIS